MWHLNAGKSERGLARESSFNLERINLRFCITLVSISVVQELLWRI